MIKTAAKHGFLLGSADLIIEVTGMGGRGGYGPPVAAFDEDDIPPGIG